MGGARRRLCGDLRCIFSRSEVGGRLAEDAGVSAAALECPRKVGLWIHPEVTTGRTQPHEHRHGVGSFGPAGEQTRVAQLRYPLELSF